jgi:DNA-binding protein H-NS
MAKQNTVDSKLDKLNALVAAEHEKFKAAVAVHIAETVAEYGLSLAELTLADLTTDAPPKATRKKKATPKKTSAKKRAAKSPAIRIDAEPDEPKRKHPIGPRGIIPAKYRDPESGATWSGLARPPAWIKDRDRSQFLINGAG